MFRTDRFIVYLVSKCKIFTDLLASTHQRIKDQVVVQVRIGVFHQNVKQSIQCVLQKLQ